MKRWRASWLLVPVGLLVCLSVGCGGPEAAYRTAIRADSTVEYRAFLARHGTTEFATEIAARLEDRWFRDIKEARTAAKFAPLHVLRMSAEFLRNYPSGKRTAVVQVILDEVADEIRVVKASPVPLLDDFEGGDERVADLGAGKFVLTPGTLQFAKVTRTPSSERDRLASAEVLITTTPPLPPVDLFLAQIKGGATVVLGMAVPRVAASGTWSLAGAVAGTTLAGDPVELPFDLEITVSPAGPDLDAAYAAALVRTYQLYRRNAALRETERDKSGYCRSSKSEYLSKCYELTAEAELLRRLVRRAVSLLDEIAAGDDPEASAVATAFFEAHPKARDEATETGGTETKSDTTGEVRTKTGKPAGRDGPGSTEVPATSRPEEAP